MDIVRYACLITPIAVVRQGVFFVQFFTIGKHKQPINACYVECGQVATKTILEIVHEVFKTSFENHLTQGVTALASVIGETAQKCSVDTVQSDYIRENRG